MFVWPRRCDCSLEHLDQSHCDLAWAHTHEHNGCSDSSRAAVWFSVVPQLRIVALKVFTKRAWRRQCPADCAVPGVRATVCADMRPFCCQVTIMTGRPHQIRIHMAALGHPLVGDPLYGPGGVPKVKPTSAGCLELCNVTRQTTAHEPGYICHSHLAMQHIARVFVAVCERPVHGVSDSCCLRVIAHILPAVGCCQQ
jgi:hypothetical protein